jgi:hypothetical protein
MKYGLRYTPEMGSWNPSLAMTHTVSDCHDLGHDFFVLSWWISLLSALILHLTGDHIDLG